MGLKPGKLRIQLAALLARHLPNVDIKPEELDTVAYSEARRKAGACLWFALTTFKTGEKCEIQCWNTMKECVALGIGTITEGQFCNYEVEVARGEVTGPVIVESRESMYRRMVARNRKG